MIPPPIRRYSPPLAPMIRRHRFPTRRRSAGNDARLTAYGDDVAQACRFRLMQAAIDEARRVAVDPLMTPTDVAAAPQ